MYRSYNLGSGVTSLHKDCQKSCSSLSMHAWNWWNEPMHPCVTCSRGIWVNALFSSMCADCAPQAAEEVLQQCAYCHSWHLTRHVCHTCLHASMSGTWRQVIHLDAALTPNGLRASTWEDASSFFLPTAHNSVVRSASAPAILVTSNGYAID